jgi:hypothetical protein
LNPDEVNGALGLTIPTEEANGGADKKLDLCYQFETTSIVWIVIIG